MASPSTLRTKMSKLIAKITGRMGKIEFMQEPFGLRVIGTTGAGNQFTNYKIKGQDEYDKFITHFKSKSDFKVEEFQ